MVILFFYLTMYIFVYVNQELRIVSGLHIVNLEKKIPTKKGSWWLTGFKNQNQKPRAQQPFPHGASCKVRFAGQPSVH